MNKSFAEFKEKNQTKNNSQEYVPEKETIFAHYSHFKELNEPLRFYPGNRFNPSLMIHELLEEGIHVLALPNEKLIRVYQSGVYSIDTGDILSKLIIRKLDFRAKPLHVNETLTLLRHRILMSLDPSGEFPFRHPNKINLKNGYIDINTSEFKEHHPEFISLIQLPIDYNPDAQCPEIDKFLTEKLKGRPDLIKLAHEIFGICALQKLPFDNVFVLLGPSHTGKSTFLKLIGRFLGGNNVSAITLQKLNDETLVFARSGLYGKLANTSSDLSSRYFTQDSYVKAISQGDDIDVEKKGVDPFKMIPFANLIAACNEIPKSRDKSDAWINRLTILPFEVPHMNEEDEMIEKLATPEELSGLFNKAFKAAQEALKRRSLTLPGEVKEERERYRRSNNQILEFFDNHYTYNKDDLDSYILEDTIYNHYKEWSEDEGLDILSKSKFREALCNILNIKNPSMPRELNRKRTYYSVVEKDFYDSDTTDEISF